MASEIEHPTNVAKHENPVKFLYVEIKTAIFSRKMAVVFLRRALQRIYFIKGESD